MTAHDAKTTTDYGEIRRWAEERGGKPATVRGTGDGEEAGVLRIAFTDNEDLEAIDWDEFFDKFEEANLAFLYRTKPLTETQPLLQVRGTRTMSASVATANARDAAFNGFPRPRANRGRNSPARIRARRTLGRQSLESQPRHLKMPSGISTLKAIALSAIA